MIEINEIGLREDDVCGRDGCTGVMEKQDKDTSCSCHICPPCSHCVDATYECSLCGFETEPPPAVIHKPTATPIVNRDRKSNKERYDALSSEEFGYLTIQGKYYWMEYWGKFPAWMTVKQILENFNVCFGYKWIIPPSNGQFHLKVYTD